MPEDIADKPVKQQRRALLQRSCYMMGVGTLVVLFISDPMVDVLDSIGSRIGIPSFYVAFILAPLVRDIWSPCLHVTRSRQLVSLPALC